MRYLKFKKSIRLFRSLDNAHLRDAFYIGASQELKDLLFKLAKRKTKKRLQLRK